MADTTVSIRVDEDVKRRFEEFCTDVGLNMSVAVNIFIRASLKEQRIPFSIESSKASNGAMLLQEMRSDAKSRGFVSDEEIEAEIKEARSNIRARRAK
jgi:DNA-damage-inducible protein J